MEINEIRIDSCFSNSQSNAKTVPIVLEVCKLYSDYNVHNERLLSEERAVGVFGRLSSEDNMSTFYKQHMEEYEKEERIVSTIKQKIISIIMDNYEVFQMVNSDKREFTGYVAEVSYTLRKNGMQNNLNAVYFIDKDIANIEYVLDDEGIRMTREFSSQQYEILDFFQQLSTEEQ